MHIFYTMRHLDIRTDYKETCSTEVQIFNRSPIICAYGLIEATYKLCRVRVLFLILKAWNTYFPILFIAFLLSLLSLSLYFNNDCPELCFKYLGRICKYFAQQSKTCYSVSTDFASQFTNTIWSRNVSKSPSSMPSGWVYILNLVSCFLYNNH